MRYINAMHDVIFEFIEKKKILMGYDDNEGDYNKPMKIVGTTKRMILNF